jgi:dienelactone hydrolase
MLMAVVLAAAWTVGCVSGVSAQGLAGYGIVLMHGKGGQPGGPIAGLATALQSEGAVVVMPRMAWSGMKGRPEKYDVSYEQALLQVDRAIEQLAARGAKKIVVAGQSLGANAAIGFAARRGSRLAGVIALAPGHTPERIQRPAFHKAVADARQMIAAGNGGGMTTFPDFNQGQLFEVSASPSAYLSFFDPNGPAVIPRNAAAMPAIPLLWVIGRNDPLAQAGRGYAFDKAAKHSKSKYVEISADHFGTPEAARQEVILWLRSL